MNTRIRFVALVRLLLVLTLVSAGVLRAQTLGAPEHYTASVIDVNSGTTGRIEIDIDRWSTSAEREQLTATLFKGGQDKLLDALRDVKPVGRIYSTGSIGYDLRYAQQNPPPAGGCHPAWKERMVCSVSRARVSPPGSSASTCGWSSEPSGNSSPRRR